MRDNKSRRKPAPGEMFYTGVEIIDSIGDTDPIEYGGGAIFSGGVNSFGQTVGPSLIARLLREPSSLFTVATLRRMR